MKFFAVFAAIVAVGFAAPTATTWTLDDLSEAIQNPATNPAHLPYLEHALNELMASMFSGQPQTHIDVSLPLLDVTQMSLAEIDAALSDPDTHPAQIPYLEHALNQYMEALFAGHQPATIGVAAPIGLFPVADTPIVAVQPEAVLEPSPVITLPAVVPETPVAPEPAAASPLVQIIVNINQVADVVAPGPVPDIAVTPVIIGDPNAPVRPSPVGIPDPVNVVEQAPEPVVVVDQAPEPVVVVDQAPEPVIVVDQVPETVVVVEPNPVDVIAVAPPETNPVDVVAIAPPETNPIDVIAVGAPEINPIDIMNPIVVAPVGAVDFGPM